MADLTTAIKVSRNLQDIAGKVDDMITAAAGERVSFSLFVWTPNSAQYISSADRGDMINVLKSMIARWEAEGPEGVNSPDIDIPVHLKN